MLDKFWVKVGARLHLGQLDLNGSLGRLYGGVGLAIDQPCLEVTAARTNELIIEGFSSETRLQDIAEKYVEFYQLPGAKIELIESLPSHSGLGSGTQLALAIGFAITRVYGLSPTITELATVTDREGSRSGIGVVAFEQGGFLVEGGKPYSEGEPENLVPPLLMRFPFPEEWGVVLALPYKEDKMYGTKEEDAFRALPPMEEEVSGRICRLTLMKLLPSLIEKDIDDFGKAVTAIQTLIGGYFAPVQGGHFATAQGFEVAEFMLSQGAAGVGQSSWGPMIFGFIRKNNQSELLNKTRLFLGDQGRVWDASGRNRGASFGWR